VIAASCVTNCVQHRAVGGAVFLEATLENKTHEGMLMESVDFIPTATYTARRIETPRTPPAEQASPLAAYIANVPLLPPEHGAASYVFELQRTPDQPKSPVRPGRRGAGREDPAAALGKLDIRWCGPLGGKARLQTQVITMPLAERKEASLAVAKLPEVLNVGQPFSMELRVENSAERPLEDLKLSYSPLAAAQAGQQQVHPEGIVLDGAQTIPVERIPPQQSVCVRLSLLPVASGRQFLQGLMLTEGDGSVHDVLRPLETFVYDKRSC